MPETKLDPAIVQYLEENIELDPEDLILKLKEKFGEQCASANCYCQALNYLKSLYLYTGYEQPPKDLHKHLINCLDNLNKPAPEPENN